MRRTEALRVTDSKDLRSKQDVSSIQVEGDYYGKLTDPTFSSKKIMMVSWQLQPAVKKILQYYGKLKVPAFTSRMNRAGSESVASWNVEASSNRNPDKDITQRIMYSTVFHFDGPRWDGDRFIVNLPTSDLFHNKQYTPMVWKIQILIHQPGSQRHFQIR